MNTPDYYKTLGVSSDASAAEIKRRYRELMVKYHPDRNHSLGAEEMSKRINEAYSVLSDPLKRAQYDRRSSEPWWYTPQGNTHRTGNQRTHTYRTYTYRTYQYPPRGRNRRKRNANPLGSAFSFFVKVVLIVVVLWILLHFAILTVGVVLTLLVFYLLWIFLAEIFYLLYGRR
ncbi:MAG: chaperone protein DnaJ [Methanolobus sp. T82-4]|jgi:curved DNA-binding protein CbpA|nr:MAG: chaperone protein DnaJ [Methanolobus sp. T82-4]